VKFDRERGTLYAPVILSTNKQVSAVSPDIRKRAVVCLIDAAIPDQQAASKEIAHRAHSQIGTALYRAYLQRLLPLLPEMREQIAERPMAPPDLRLRYVHEEDLRRRVQLQLNRGESRHALARWLFFANRGEFRSGDYEEIMNKASCLSLLSNAVLVWNTMAIMRIITQLRAAGENIVDETGRVSHR